MLDDAGIAPEALVTMLYRLLLGREPDEAGLRAHAQALNANRLTPRQLAREFVASEEFAGLERKAKGQIRLNALGCEFVVPADAPVVHEIASAEGYEPWVLPYFLEQCRPGMTVMDIGASWGVFALPAARRVGDAGKVYAVEVSPWNCQVLAKSMKASGLSNVSILPFGVSDRLGSELLRVQRSTNNNAISTGDDTDLEQMDAYDVVPVAPLDLLRDGLGPVHIVKMDIEGMEHRAAIGGRAFFRDQRPLVFLEYSPAFQRIGSGVDGSDLLGLFLDMGYAVEVLHRGRPREMAPNRSHDETIGSVDAAWRRHVAEDGGTHLDLCLHPPRPV